MTPSDIRDQLAVDGFAVINGRLPEISGVAAFSGLGSVVRLPGVTEVQVLTRRHTDHAPPNTYSGHFGVQAFPLHTDLAHWLLGLQGVPCPPTTAPAQKVAVRASSRDFPPGPVPNASARALVSSADRRGEYRGPGHARGHRCRRRRPRWSAGELRASRTRGRGPGRLRRSPRPCRVTCHAARLALHSGQPVTLRRRHAHNVLRAVRLLDRQTPPQAHDQTELLRRPMPRRRPPRQSPPISAGAQESISVLKPPWSAPDVAASCDTVCRSVVSCRHA